MVNKLWYQEDPEDTKWVRGHLQELIDLYCFDSKIFKEPEDITLDNLKEFLETVLTHYQYYNLNRNYLLSLGDAFDIYIGDAFSDEFPEDYPNYPNTDRRQLALNVCRNCIQCSTFWLLLPEDVPFVIECLNAPEAEIANMYDRLDKYFYQFDISKKSEEYEKRWQAIRRERIKILQNNEPLPRPLPIRPMSIELDPCFKDKNSPTA